MKNHSPSYDPLRSFYLAQVIQAEPLRCWRNAVLSIAHFPELFANGWYVEGWIVVPRATIIEVVEHGWCCTAEPRILDPTLVVREAAQRPIWHFPGLQVPANQLQQRTHGNVLPLVCHTDFGEDGMEHAEYKRAYEQACSQAHTLARQHHLPEEAVVVSRRNSQQRGFTLLLQPPGGDE